MSITLRQYVKKGDSMNKEYKNIEPLDTKALPRFSWGQEWVKPNGDLTCIVVLYEDFDEPVFLDRVFPNSALQYCGATGALSEKSFYKHYTILVKDWINKHPEDMVVITAKHAFALNLITNSDFRPDMFYLYDSKKGYRRLPDTTPIFLRRTQNYQRMYIADAFDGGDGSFEKDITTE